MMMPYDKLFTNRVTRSVLGNKKPWPVNGPEVSYAFCSQAKEALTFVHGLTSSGRTIRIGLHISLYGPNTPVSK